MLSAKSSDLDKILGLSTGADDYVTKPFNPLELTARVKSQLRRFQELNPGAGQDFISDSPDRGNDLILAGILLHLAAQTR